MLKSRRLRFDGRGLGTGLPIRLACGVADEIFFNKALEIELGRRPDVRFESRSRSRWQGIRVTRSQH